MLDSLRLLFSLKLFDLLLKKLNTLLAVAWALVLFKLLRRLFNLGLFSLYLTLVPLFEILCFVLMLNNDIINLFLILYYVGFIDIFLELLETVPELTKVSLKVAGHTV